MTANTGWPSAQPENAENGGWGAPTEAENSSLFDTPTPAPQKASPRLRLDTVADVRRELRRVYIDARNGGIGTTEATKYAYLLDLMSRMIERTDLEARIEALEARRTLQ